MKVAIINEEYLQEESVGFYHGGEDIEINENLTVKELLAQMNARDIEYKYTIVLNQEFVSHPELCVTKGHTSPHCISGCSGHGHCDRCPAYSNDSGKTWYNSYEEYEKAKGKALK